LPLARRGRVDRRAAARTERLDARIAALGRGLQIAGRLSRHPERRAGNRDRDAERGAGAGLAIGAMADRGLLRIGLGFDGDVAAVARAVDFHAQSPLASNQGTARLGWRRDWLVIEPVRCLA